MSCNFFLQFLIHWIITKYIQIHPYEHNYICRPRFVSWPKWQRWTWYHCFIIKMHVPVKFQEKFLNGMIFRLNYLAKSRRYILVFYYSHFRCSPHDKHPSSSQDQSNFVRTSNFFLFLFTFNVDINKNKLKNLIQTRKFKCLFWGL